MAMRHTVHDPRRDAVVHGRRKALRPGSVRMPGPLAVPTRLSTAPSIAGSDLESIAEDGASICSGASRSRQQIAKGPREAALQRREPWRSEKVADFVARVGQDKAAEALSLEGQQGTVLRAVGEAADHQVASGVVVSMERQRLAGAAKKQPKAAPGSSGGGQGGDLALVRPPSQAINSEMLPRSAHGRGDVAFGAVYEYRDSCGTPKVVASTSSLPERQFLLDRKQHGNALAGKQDGALVWVGVSGGRGGLSEAQMTEVRRAVADARADRLQAQKLCDIKPYSRHG